MKLIIVAVATVLALSSAALAGDFSVDGMNGSTLGKSMRGVYNGVPYPNTNAVNRIAPVESWNAMRRGHHHHWHYKHHRHHWHHKH
jgi:hypothetical protein